MQTTQTKKNTTPTRNERKGSAGDLRAALQNEFVARCRRNSSYSLRAYAKSLAVDQSLLSKILRGQRKISPANAQILGRSLGLSPAEIARVSRREAKGPAYDQMAEDVFGLLADWYHFALLELLKLPACRHETAWMARRLGIHALEVEQALERLERLGYLKRKAGRWLLLSPNNSWTNTDVTSSARRVLQKTLLRKSEAAIDQIAFDRRENASLTLACDESLLPEIKERLKAYRKDLDAFVQQRGNYNQVYQFVVSFFPLTEFSEV
jgi:DNA-binding transcriptional regulator YhcF (GntR family)